tara:strand:- start:264 stop:851 length:588 start_codon:yes stop_codon:yes gene_type:complete
MKKFKDYVAEQLAEAKGASLTQSQKAIRFAANAHRKQTRTSGDAYITHPVEVAKIVKQFKKSHNLEALISAAYLHDTVEDTDTELEDITKMFGGLVASMVKELTSDEQSKEFKASKADYLSAKMSSMSSWALVVKLADRIHNISDLNTAKTKKWASNYKKQTTQIVDELEKNRTLTGTHKKMIKSIRMKLKEFEE